MNSLQQSSIQHPAKTPTQFVMTRLPTTRHRAHECLLWDAGHWQLENAQSLELHHNSEKELGLFLEALQKFKKNTVANDSPFGIVATTPSHIEAAGDAATHFFIPGEFCRQGDVLAAAAHSGAMVLIERGAFLAPNDLLRAVEKLDPKKVMLVDAGTSFGYSDRVLDVRALAVLKATGLPFGVNLSALCSPQGQVSAWKAQWISDALSQDSFVSAFVDTSSALGATFFVYRDEESHVRRKLERKNH